MKVIIFFIILTFLASCDESDQERYANIISTDNLILTIENHPHGYQEKNCFYCHVKENLHQAPDTTNSGLLNDARSITEARGENGCVDCHGTNGVQ